MHMFFHFFFHFLFRQFLFFSYLPNHPLGLPSSSLFFPTPPPSFFFFTFDKRDINLRKIGEPTRLIFRTKFPFDGRSIEVGVLVNSRGRRSQSMGIPFRFKT